MLTNSICSKKAEIKCMATHLDRVCLRKKTKQEAIYFMSTLERHSARKKAPKPTESVEEAALKASGPMPRALLIVTSAFLSSNSDWWVHQGGGGGYSSEETGSVWCWKTLCSSPISPVRGLTRGIQGNGAFAAPSVDTGLVSPPPTKHSSAASSHLFFTVILTSMNCHAPPAPDTSSPDLHHLLCLHAVFHFLKNLKRQIMIMFTINMPCPESRGTH